MSIPLSFIICPGSSTAFHILGFFLSVLSDLCKRLLKKQILILNNDEYII